MKYYFKKIKKKPNFGESWALKQKLVYGESDHYHTIGVKHELIGVLCKK